MLTKSQIKLMQLNFDPIESLVKMNDMLQRECTIHEELRDNSRVILGVDGKPRKYNSLAHQSCLDKMIQISDKLLRYGYQRVPEMVQIEETKPRSLQITLTDTNENFVLSEVISDNMLEERDD